MEVPRGMEPTGTNGRTRHTLSDPLVGGLGLVLWWFSRWMARNAVSCGHDDAGKAFIVRVRCPVPGPPRSESVAWLVPLPADPGWGLAVRIGFAVVMAQVRRPVPFRTRKLRPGTAMVLHSRGCGRVARRRILSLGVPVELRLREPPFLCFVVPASRPEHVARGPEDFSCSRSARSVSGFQREFLLFHKDFW